MTRIDNQVLLANIQDIKCDIVDMKTKLFGNGQPGLLDRVTGLESMHKEKDKNDVRFKSFITICIAVMSVAIIVVGTVLN